MPTYEDPGLFCKLCCPYCAVYQANGCVCPQMLFVYCFGFCYTMCCWDPTVKPGGAPENDAIER